MVSYATGDATAATEGWFKLNYGIQVRRDDNTVEFKGPPTKPLSLAMTFANRDIRFRLCDTYVIVDEYWRFDSNGVSNILRNVDELEKDPEYEFMCFNTDFDPLRLRFDNKLAELDCIDERNVLTEIIRPNLIQ